jgi:hypothetical protein
VQDQSEVRPGGANLGEIRVISGTCNIGCAQLCDKANIKARAIKRQFFIVFKIIVICNNFIEDF